jgi:hypothetical protein
MHPAFLDAGTRLVGISVDPPGANAGMVAKLRLPFPLLSDPGGTDAVKPYGVWDDDNPRGIARPAVSLVGPEGEERFRVESRDFADRQTEDAALAAARALGLPPTTQEPPAPGTPEPRPKAMTLEGLPLYFRGARFAAVAVAGRVPEAAGESQALVEQVDRYRDAVQQLLDGG